MRPAKETNFLYFTLFFALLVVCTLASCGIPFLFAAYGIAQALLEVTLLCTIAYLLPKKALPLFAAASFVLLLAHITQSLMARLMDTGLHYIFSFFLGDGVRHFLAVFQALNLNWTMIALVFTASLLLPFLGIGLYALTARVSQKNVSLRQLIYAVSVASALAFSLDAVNYFVFPKAAYDKYEKALPLAAALFTPRPPVIHLKRPLKLSRDEKVARAHIPDLKLPRRPNLYFFVVEALRKDFLEAAPNLSRFAEDHIEIPGSFSNANSTALSWVSLFHSDLPLQWTEKREWERGSIPLEYLKKLGYKIHVYSSADFHFFHMDKILFGENEQLVDHLEEYASDRSIEPWQRDAKCLTALKRDLAPQGHAYFIFLDSTHSEYSFPPEKARYTPFVEQLDYLTIGPDCIDMPAIKNRYRNAIAHIDDLMGDFFTTLHEHALFDDAIVSITGDHGEEFFEEGAIFHGTHLNRYQTSVPILLKFPDKSWTPKTQVATHIDIFPSILHYLTHQSDFRAFCDGTSIFVPRENDARIAVLHDGVTPPKEFAITTPTASVHARFVDSATLQILQQEGNWNEALERFLAAPE